MKRLIVLLMLAVVALPALAKGDWKGKVVDEKGEPVPYANVAVLSKTDSTVVCGVVTQEDGTFNIVTSETDGIMMVAMLGYKTVYLAPVDGAVITLSDDTQMLEGAVASAVMPKTKLTGRAFRPTCADPYWRMRDRPMTCSPRRRVFSRVRTDWRSLVRVRRWCISTDAA